MKVTHSDIRDIILFIAGILFLIFPPAWLIRYESRMEGHEVLFNFITLAFVAGVLIMGYLYKVWKGKR